MTFATGYLADPNKVGAGERYGDANVILSATTFENGLVVGRFAKLDTGSIDNVDSSATPVVAGVVLRNVAAAVESAATVDSDIYSQVSYLRAGLVTVEVVTGETPAAFGQVYVENLTAADYGKATTTAVNNVEIAAEFIEEVDTDVWLVRLK